jgi:type I restriction enzyme S subunit
MKMLKPKGQSLPLNLVFHALNNVGFQVGDHKRHWISEFSKLKIKWPIELKEQKAIATILSDMDEETQVLEQRLNKTRQIKQGMIQELLTGKTRLLVPQVRG